jgi:hypothetical protein
MGSTRKKNGGKKKTLKYGGGRNNYKKGSFKNRRKMTIRNGEGLKGGMYRFKDENNFKTTDSTDTIRDKLTRMYTRKIGEPSKLRDYMKADWERYLSSISKADRTKMEALAETVTSAVAAPSTSRKSPSPSRGSAAAASSSASAARALEDDLYRELSVMLIKPAQSKKTRKEYENLYRQITGEEPSSDKMSDADLQDELDRITSGRRSPSKFTPEEEAELDKELDRIANSD